MIESDSTLKSNVMEPVSFMRQTFQCIQYSHDAYELSFTMEEKGFVPAHYHPFMDELFEITGGQGEFIVDGVKTSAKPGDTILVKRGVVHSLKTSSQGPMTCRVVYSPCSDTHKMFAILGGLKLDGNKGSALIFKGEYLNRKAKLETFSKSAGAMGAIENAIMSLVMLYGNLRGWHRLLPKYLGE